jgi:hypothetical protein
MIDPGMVVFGENAQKTHAGWSLSRMGEWMKSRQSTFRQVTREDALHPMPLSETPLKAS